MTISIILRSAEVKLVEMLNTVREPAGWQAVHFRLSDLLDQYKSEYQTKIAVNLVNDLLKNYDGGIFLLMDHSIVVLVGQLERPVLNKLIFQLRYLYMDDPLAYTDEGHENPDFCTIYDLTRDWQTFFDLCTQRMAVSLRKSAMPERKHEVPRSPVLEAQAETRLAAPAPAPLDSGLTMARLAGIERDLQQADINAVLRKQPVCTIASNMAVRRVFDELYIHIAHLRQMLRSDVDFLSNRWLFKYLTHRLDERMLDLIRQNPARHLESPVSININIETLLSSAFDAFDAAIRPEAKVAIVFEVPVIDVFVDMAAFHVAREQVQRLGYRMCLDGLTVDSFLNIDRTRLGLDLIKVQWNADAEGDLKLPKNQELAKAVRDCGSNRVVLCRCDNRQSVQFGQALGISLFQGRFVDSLINPLSKVAN